MRLIEMKSSSTLPVGPVLSALRKRYSLSQVGGPSRTYDVNGNMGMIYLVDRGLKGLGVVINAGKLATVAVWNKMNFDTPPDYAVDIPANIDQNVAISDIITFVSNPNMLTEDEIPKDAEVHLVARRGNEYFRIPNMQRLEKQLTTIVKEKSKGTTSAISMEDQYKSLQGKIELIAGKKSHNVKSLLITGAPSTGKTFTVMEVIKKNLKLREGVDYVTKKGKITAKGLYRVLIEQLHGLAIFDDCDSVVDDKNGVNMLKGALDTDAIRTVDYDVQGALNTGAMTFERRGEIVSAMSSILRGVANSEEIGIIEGLMPEKERVVSNSDDKNDNEDPFEIYQDENGELSLRERQNTVSKERMVACESWVMRNLPNKIDFYGGIIFISNMEADDWDSAIITRAFHQDMNFSSGDMLTFIKKIKKNIGAAITEEQKDEVLDYIEELYKTGQLTKQINFRLIMKCFDLYLMQGYDWQQLIREIG